MNKVPCNNFLNKYKNIAKQNRIPAGKLKEKRLDQSLFSYYHLLFSKIVFRVNFRVNSGRNFVEDKMFPHLSFTGDLV